MRRRDTDQQLPRPPSGFWSAKRQKLNRKGIKGSLRLAALWWASSHTPRVFPNGAGWCENNSPCRGEGKGANQEKKEKAWR